MPAGTLPRKSGNDQRGGDSVAGKRPHLTTSHCSSSPSNLLRYPRRSPVLQRGDEPKRRLIIIFSSSFPNHLVGTFFSAFVTMNSSEEIAYQMRRMSLASDCGGSASVPPPPEMLALSAKIMSEAAAMHRGFELDCSHFAMTVTPSASRTSLDTSYTGASAFSPGSLTRSHCVTSNLSTYGSSSPTSTHPRRQMPQQVPSPNDGWGYFVDSVDR